MAFTGEIFPECLSFGTAGGPGWSTDVIDLGSAHERRNQLWEDTRYRWDAAMNVKTYPDLRLLIALFQRCRGRTHTFLWKDWLDFEASTDHIKILDDGTGQASKIYGDYIREIYRLKAGVTVSGLTLGGADLDTGILTLSGMATDTYSSIDRTNPANVNHAGHGRATGDQIRITGEAGMTEVNNKAFTITVAGPDDYTLSTENGDLDATGFAADGTGGTITIYPSTIGWSGEFYVHCRFGSDQLSTSLDAYNIGSASVPIVEDREDA